MLQTQSSLGNDFIDARGYFHAEICLKLAVAQCRDLGVQVDFLLVLGMYDPSCACRWCLDRYFKHQKQLASEIKSDAPAAF